MGFWYLVAMIIGAVLYIKITFFNKAVHWKTAVSIQISVMCILLVCFCIAMLTPAGTRLADLLFS